MLSWRHLGRHEEKAKDNSYSVHVFARDAAGDTGAVEGGTHITTSPPVHTYHAPSSKDYSKPSEYPVMENWEQELVVFTLTKEIIAAHPDIWIAFVAEQGGTYGAFIADVSMAAIEVVVPDVPEEYTTAQMPADNGSVNELPSGVITDSQAAAPVNNPSGTDPNVEVDVFPIKAATELKVGKLRKAIDETGDPRGGNGAALMNIDRDNDRFYVRINSLTKTQGIKNKTVSVTIQTVNPDPTYNHGPVIVDLKPGEAGSQFVGGMVSASQLLVADETDDIHSQPDDGGVVGEIKLGSKWMGKEIPADGARNDRTHRVQLGGKVKVTSLKIGNNPKPIALNIELPVKVIKVVKVRLVVLDDSGMNLNRLPDELKQTQERMAQVGVRLQFSGGEALRTAIKRGTTTNLISDVSSLPNIFVDMSKSPPLVIKKFDQNTKDIMEAFNGDKDHDDIIAFYCRNTGGDNEGFSAFNSIGENQNLLTWWPKNYNNCVFIYATDHSAYTLAHELVHVLTQLGHYGEEYADNVTNDDRLRNLMRAGGAPFEHDVGEIAASKRLVPFQEGRIQRHKLAKNP